MSRFFIAALLLASSLAAAHAFGMGRFSSGFSKLGSLGQRGVAAPPLTPCTSTGIFNLANTCNDIYFIGALK